MLLTFPSKLMSLSAACLAIGRIYLSDHLKAPVPGQAALLADLLASNGAGIAAVARAKTLLSVACLCSGRIFPYSLIATLAMELDLLLGATLSRDARFIDADIDCTCTPDGILRSVTRRGINVRNRDARHISDCRVIDHRPEPVCRMMFCVFKADAAEESVQLQHLRGRPPDGGAPLLGQHRQLAKLNAVLLLLQSRHNEAANAVIHPGKPSSHWSSIRQSARL